jgi:holo-[acyl-carrier protein] synthase
MANRSTVRGIGTDLVDVARFRGVLERTPGVVDRLFTDDELEVVAPRRDRVPGLAARFAAKEAVMKAMQCGMADVAFTEIEVRGGGASAPTVSLSGRAAERAAARGISTWHLSLTHTDELAHAMVVAEG